MSARILTGDVRDMLATLPDESVHCVVTSPPYWRLRDYGVEGQLGMEPTMGEHIDTMVDVFREVRRVLRKDGCCWINYGDCYISGQGGRQSNDGAKPKTAKIMVQAPWNGNKPGAVTSKIVPTELAPKQLAMIPNRLAIALQDDGWWVRSEIIWAKPNPMPESATDRPATAHEKVWLLTKSARYFYDAEAVRRPIAPGSVDRYAQDIDSQEGSHRANGGAKTNGTMKAVGGPRKDKQRGHSRKHAGFNDRWDAMPKAEQVANGANLRNVWTIPTKGFSGAHYATFPPDLIVPCIKAGTSEKGCCAECGAPWVREFESTIRHTQKVRNCTDTPGFNQAANRARDGHVAGVKSVTTTGWSPSCACDAATIPCTILDPFIGSGTTAMVADRLGRNCIGIDLNPANVEMARDRIAGDAGLFAEVAAP